MDHQHAHFNDLNHKTPHTFHRMASTVSLNLVIAMAEIAGGIFSGSIALISDAFHNLSDALSVTISYVAIKISKRPKTADYTFGLKRIEILAAVFNSSILIAICFYIFKEAYVRLSVSYTVAGFTMTWVAVIGLAANIGGTLLLRPLAKKGMNIRSSYLHLLSDAISSLGVVVGGLCIIYFKAYWVDPVLSIFIALYILKESIQIVSEATGILMMKAPHGLDLEFIKKEIEKIDGVNNIHHVHAWRLNENDIHFEAHIEVDSTMTINESTGLINKIKDHLSTKYNINHITIQFETDICKSKELISISEKETRK